MTTTNAQIKTQTPLTLGAKKYDYLWQALRALPHAKRYFGDKKDNARIKFSARAGGFYIQDISTGKIF